ncbi:Prolactin 2 [Crotalus adamanteus]|uniref:Prolactin 2 n=1 Tax=Crotalus adamanteus TaxID=8729 RepID=A0AAW1BCG4_CROAD
MQSVGIISNLLNCVRSSETAVLSITNGTHFMSDYEFIQCSTENSNKVQHCINRGVC